MSMSDGLSVEVEGLSHFSPKSLLTHIVQDEHLDSVPHCVSMIATTGSVE